MLLATALIANATGPIARVMATSGGTSRYAVSSGAASARFFGIISPSNMWT